VILARRFWIEFEVSYPTKLRGTSQLFSTNEKVRQYDLPHKARESNIFKFASLILESSSHTFYIETHKTKKTSMKITILSTLLLLLLPLFVVGQDDFQCGVPELAEEMKIDKDFDTIVPEGDCQSNDGSLVPKTIHWHIYAIPDGEAPRISMLPEDLVEPYVSGGSLQFNFQEDALQGLSKGDIIKTAVNIYIPVSRMKKIGISGVDQNIEVINKNPLLELESITINDSGVDNRLYVDLGV
jgi:hypothetical protein